MMAEKSDVSTSEAGSTPQEEKSSGNWWDSWISSAKTKSAEVYSMVKKDLDEIGSAVKSEASHVLTSTSNVIGKTLKLDVPESPANVMKKSFSSFIGQVSTVLNPEPDDEDDTEVILSSGDTTMLSTYKKELEALQRVDATYIVPAYSPEFEAWRSSLEASDVVISPVSAVRKLETNPVLRAQYEKLVPDAVSHDDFWERYLYRVALLQDRLAAAARRRPLDRCSDTADPVIAHLPLQTAPPAAPVAPAALAAPAAPVAPHAPIVQQSPKKVLSGIDPEEADSVVTWEDEDFANDVELTEEQQTLLLEEYEREIATKKLNRQPSIRDSGNNNAVTDTNDNRTAPVKSKDKKSKLRTPKKVKADECGNLVEDYFGDKEVKDDASANSDESWEKDFEAEVSDARA